MTRHRRWLLSAAAIAIAAIAVTTYVRSREVTRPHQAIGYAELGTGGDPLVIMIGVAWSEDGYCSGQFTVSATETATEIRVSDVVERVIPRGSTCDGLGTVDHLAWAPLTLTAPLRDRIVVRAADGVTLPNRTRVPAQ